MRTINIKNKILKVYDSIDEMPIVNFQKYNKYLLIDSGIGSSVDDIDAHISKIARFIKVDKDKAIQELQNMRTNLIMISSGISPKYLAFASLIHSIDGKKVDDLSDENLSSILSSLKTVKHSWLVSLVQSVKKKIDTELEMYFPDNFVNPKEKEAYDKLKLRTMLVLEGLIYDKNNAESIEHIDTFMLSLHKPNSFDGAKSIEIKYDKQFETACICISQKTGLVAKDMTVLQFYSAVDSIKKQAEAELKASRRKR